MFVKVQADWNLHVLELSLARIIYEFVSAFIADRLCPICPDLSLRCVSLPSGLRYLLLARGRLSPLARAAPVFLGLLDSVPCKYKQNLNMGFRLGHRIVKLWRWIKRSRKPSSYARLNNQKRRKSVRLRIGSGFCRRSTDSQALLHSQVSLLNSEELRDCQLLHLRHLDLQSLRFPHWQITPHFHIPPISDGYKKALQYYESGRSNHVPKGFLAVYVGQGEEHRRFEIPVPYFNHPLFGELLKETEEEYGFDQRGALNIPCKLSHFENVQKLIHSERSHKHKH